MGNIFREIFRILRYISQMLVEVILLSALAGSACAKRSGRHERNSTRYSRLKSLKETQRLTMLLRKCHHFHQQPRCEDGELHFPAEWLRFKGRYGNAFMIMNEGDSLNGRSPAMSMRYTCLPQTEDEIAQIYFDPTIYKDAKYDKEEC